MQIPPNILLTIFGYLDLKSLCLTSRVCRLWHTYANDPSLWKILDLRPYHYNLRNMWKIINRRISEHSQEVHIKGYLTTTKKLDNLSTPLLGEIKKRAPHLSSLTLSYCDLKNIDVGSLPGSINKLCLSHSLLPLGWFDTLKTRDVFPFVRDLDLTSCTRVSSGEITSICHLHTLETLRLNGCYRVTDDDVREIATKLPNVVFLDISDCKKITDTSLQHITRHLKVLKKLCVRNCHLISDLGLASLKDGSKNLEFLDLTGCSEATRCHASKTFADCIEMTVYT